MKLNRALRTAVWQEAIEGIQEQNALAAGNVAATSTGGKAPKEDLLWSNPTVTTEASSLEEANTMGGLYGFSLTGDGEIDGTMDDPDPDQNGHQKDKKNKKRKSPEKKKNPTAEIMWGGDVKPGELTRLKYTALEESLSPERRESGTADNNVRITLEKKLDPRSVEVIKDFIRFCQDKLRIKKYPHIFLHAKKKPNMTTGSYMMDDNTLHVLVGKRLVMDVLRTIAHELTHRKQHETGLLDQELAKQDPLDEMGDLNTVYENEAYEKAGNFVKEFARRYKKFSKEELYSLSESKAGKNKTVYQSKLD